MGACGVKPELVEHQNLADPCVAQSAAHATRATRACPICQRPAASGFHHCCRTCQSSQGRSHGPTCEALYAAACASPEAAKAVADQQVAGAAANAGEEQMDGVALQADGRVEVAIEEILPGADKPSEFNMFQLDLVNRECPSGVSYNDLQQILLREGQNGDDSSCIYFFIHRDTLLKLQGPLPTFGKLANDEQLRPFKISIGDVVRGRLRKRFAVISHRWVKAWNADPSGQQLKAIQNAVLNGVDDIVEYFWIDVACLPQRVRNEKSEVVQELSVKERQYFDRCLRYVNFLYLGGEVWILFTLDYIHRFWCALEAFLAVHDANAHGFKASQDHHRVVFLGEAARHPELWTPALMSVVAGKSLQAMLDTLADEAFTVTSHNDKDIQISMLRGLEVKIKRACSEELGEMLDHKFAIMTAHPDWPFNMIRIRRYAYIAMSRGPMTSDIVAIVPRQAFTSFCFHIDELRSTNDFWKLATGMKQYLKNAGFTCEDYDEDLEGFVVKEYQQPDVVGKHMLLQPMSPTHAANHALGEVDRLKTEIKEMEERQQKNTNGRCSDDAAKILELVRARRRELQAWESLARLTQF